MLIDFSKMEEQVIPQFLGGEGTFRTRMRVDDLYSGREGEGALRWRVYSLGCRELPLLSQGTQSQFNQRQRRTSDVLRCCTGTVRGCFYV